jgi:hypothetical protein
VDVLKPAQTLDAQESNSGIGEPLLTEEKEILETRAELFNDHHPEVALGTIIVSLGNSFPSIKELIKRMLVLKLWESFIDIFKLDRNFFIGPQIQCLKDVSEGAMPDLLGQLVPSSSYS